MSDEIKPHNYVPSAMHMGDCAVCGHIQNATIHRPWRYVVDIRRVNSMGGITRSQVKTPPTEAAILERLKAIFAKPDTINSVLITKDHSDGTDSQETK